MGYTPGIGGCEVGVEPEGAVGVPDGLVSVPDFLAGVAGVPGGIVDVPGKVRGVVRARGVVVARARGVVVVRARGVGVVRGGCEDVVVVVVAKVYPAASRMMKTDGHEDNRMACCRQTSQELERDGQ